MNRSRAGVMVTMSKSNHSEVDIDQLVREEDWSNVAGTFAEMHPADIADCIDRAPTDLHDDLFALLTEDLKPDVLAELESAAGSDVLESLTTSQIAEIAEDMPPDDAADVLADLTEDRSDEVLELMDEKESRDVRQLLTYEDDTAGGIMTTDVVAMREQQTAQEAINAIAYLDTEERFVYAYTVDASHRLIGYTDIWDLLRERQRDKKLAELVHRDVVSANVDMDQEEVAHLMSQYDLTTLPVTDAAGTLVGRITIDDVVDVMEEEASEDIFRLAGSDDAELEHTSPLKSAAIRLPWLLLTLVGGFVTSLVFSKFHTHIASVIILASFVPIVLAMGGNTGIQSSTLIVRSIALGTLKGRSVLRMLGREALLGALMGTVCGVIIWMWAWFLISGESIPFSAAQLAAVVALALFAAMMFAATFGALVPILLDRFRVDPAVASGPFITITNDISALLIYFCVTVLLLQKLGGVQ